MNTEKRAKPRRLGRRILIIVGVLGMVAAGGVWAAKAKDAERVAMTAQFITEPARRTHLRVTVTEDGQVESSQNLELKCRVEKGSQILWIIPDGTEVETGEVLCKLDSAPIEDKIMEQRILYEKAYAAMKQAEQSLAVAEISVREFAEGTFHQELQQIEAQIVIAEQSLKSCQNMLEHSNAMFRKGYVNRLQMETNADAVARSNLDLDSAKTARKVLVEFSGPKRMKELESQRDAADSLFKAEKTACDLEKAKLDRLEKQLESCTIIAPRAGMVVYANANDRSRRDTTSVIEEGAMVREFQTIVRLPDLTQMQVQALVHETKVDRVRAGLPAEVTIRGRRLRGLVTAVASQPAPTNWYGAEVKEYQTTVRIEDQVFDLKPGMTAEVTILTEEHPDVVVVPLQGVVEKGRRHYIYVRSGEGYAEREVELGASNEQGVVVRKGLAEGELVILNSRTTIPEAAANPDESVLERAALVAGIQAIEAKDPRAAKESGTANVADPEKPESSEADNVPATAAAQATGG